MSLIDYETEARGSGTLNHFVSNALLENFRLWTLEAPWKRLESLDTSEVFPESEPL